LVFFLSFFYTNTPNPPPPGGGGGGGGGIRNAQLAKTGMESRGFDAESQSRTS
jgi:hypothetical protein